MCRRNRVVFTSHSQHVRHDVQKYTFEKSNSPVPNTQERSSQIEISFSRCPTILISPNPKIKTPALPLPTQHIQTPIQTPNSLLYNTTRPTSLPIILVPFPLSFSTCLCIPNRIKPCCLFYNFFALPVLLARLSVLTCVVRYRVFCSFF